MIFSTLIEWWMKKFNYQQNITKLAKPLVAATLEVYESAQRELLPTPTKSHYTFNLRDVSKVFQVRPSPPSASHFLGPPHCNSHTPHVLLSITALICLLAPQGITKAAGSVDESLTMVRLWTHEVLRVFYDRYMGVGGWGERICIGMTGLQEEQSTAHMYPM